MAGRSPLRRWPGRLRALPPGRRRLVVAAVALGYAVLVYGLALGAHTALGGGPVDWARPAVPALTSLIGLLTSVAVVSWWPRHRSRVARRGQLRPFETAARTGRLPDGADPAVWRPFLVARQRVHRRRTTVTLVAVAAVAAGLLVLVVLLTDAAISSVVLCVLVAGQALTWVSVAGQRTQRRLTAMLGRLPEDARADRVAG